MSEKECLTLISKKYRFQTLDEDTAIFEEYDKQRHSIINQYLIEYYKMFDKTILSGMSIEKLKKLVLSDTVKIILLSREFSQKYFGAFISHARREILSLLQDKISSGKLKIIYTGPPTFWNKPTPSMLDGLSAFKKYFESSK